MISKRFVQSIFSTVDGRDNVAMRLCIVGKEELVDRGEELVERPLGVVGIVAWSTCAGSQESSK
jgi:hypothetical protein